MPPTVILESAAAPAPAASTRRPAAAASWLNVLSHLDARYGGLSSVVPQLCAAVGETDLASPSIAAFCLPNERMEPALLPSGTTSFWPVNRLEWLTCSELSRSFRSAVEQADGVHIHGLWEQSTEIAARTAHSLGKPYIVSAHGMLEPWALRNKRLKKKLYAAIFERRNLAEAACLHALTTAEAEDYRRFGCTNPIVVIPNAVHTPEAVDAQRFLDSFPSLRGKTLILFLGRLHFKKGLKLLVECWADLSSAWPDAHLVLAGPDSENTRAGIEQQIERDGIGDRVTFTGMLDSAMKWSAYAAASCFVLPSYSEGLSASLLEAMAAGKPVIVTEQSHMPEVAQHQAGWVIQPTPADLSCALVAALSASTAEMEAMGRNGRALVEGSYSWPSVGRRMGEVYQWLAGGPVPQSLYQQAGGAA